MMTDTLRTVMSPPPPEPDAESGPVVTDDPPVEREPTADELAAMRRMVRQARADGVALTGPSGLLKALSKTIAEIALDEEMTEHLG
jgi:putative transposase